MHDRLIHVDYAEVELRVLAHMLDDHKEHIIVTRLGSDWAAVHVWWNPEHGGFWEPWQTGIGRFATKEEAIPEATGWAEAEELELRLS